MPTSGARRYFNSRLAADAPATPRHGAGDRGVVLAAAKSARPTGPTSVELAGMVTTLSMYRTVSRGPFW